MNQKELAELQDEVCAYTVDLYRQSVASSPSFSLMRANAALIKQSGNWPDTTQLKDGYGNWNWEELWWPNRFKKEFFCIAMCDDENVDALFCGKIISSTSEVRLEYVQRNANAVKMKGIVTPVAVTFAAAFAISMDIESVVVCDPAPKIVTHYSEHMSGIVSIAYKNNVVKSISARAQDIIGYEQV